MRILEAPEDLPDDSAHPEIDSAYHAVILKALLVHSARWGEDTVDALKTIISENGKLHGEHERDEINRFLGFGCPDIERVVELRREPRNTDRMEHDQFKGNGPVRRAASRRTGPNTEAATTSSKRRRSVLSRTVVSASLSPASIAVSVRYAEIARL